ncbi:MAG: SRPBCC family protein [Elainella sp.]
MFAITKKLWLNASPAAVFEALTSSDKIVQYYPLTEVSSTWQPGGEILLKGRSGDQDFTDYGTIEVLLPNQQFQYRYWSDNHGTERLPENHLTICYGLEPADFGTRLKLEQQNLQSEAMYLQMLQVWDLLLANLKAFVESSGST